jgi:hypothetical protein
MTFLPIEKAQERMSSLKMNRTTRLTSPEPTGAGKWLQDMWDNARNKQVKTYMEFDTKMSVLNFARALRLAIDKLNSIPHTDKPVILECYGSYDLTDKYLADGETENPEAQAFQMNFIRRLGNVDAGCFLTNYAKSKNIDIAARGVRETGCMVFGDRREPIDPTKGFSLNMGADGIPTAIKNIETYYVILTRAPKKDM